MLQNQLGQDRCLDTSRAPSVCGTKFDIAVFEDSLCHTSNVLLSSGQLCFKVRFSSFLSSWGVYKFSRDCIIRLLFDRLADWLINWLILWLIHTNAYTQQHNYHKQLSQWWGNKWPNNHPLTPFPMMRFSTTWPLMSYFTSPLQRWVKHCPLGAFP